MIYQHIKTGTFISRPNRFIAHVRLEGQTVVCHVKNTGRCRELLIPGVKVILQYHPDAAAAGRKTEYDLIGVYKGGILINMDSQAPNRAAWEWLDTLESIPGLPGWAPVSYTHLGGQFVLCRRNLVVLRLGRDAQLPKLFIHIVHVGTDPLADGAKVMVLQLLPLGRHGAEQGASGVNQVLAL